MTDGPMNPRTEGMIQARAVELEGASRVLIGLVRTTEKFEKDRAASAKLTLEVELDDGTLETWQITIRRAPQ